MEMEMETMERKNGRKSGGCCLEGEAGMREEVAELSGDEWRNVFRTCTHLCDSGSLLRFFLSLLYSQITMLLVDSPYLFLQFE